MKKEELVGKRNIVGKTKRNIVGKSNIVIVGK